jgi:hypothetical protein
MHSEQKEYWNNRYKEAQTAWDMGYPSTPIKTFIDGLVDKNQPVLIPGCGNAYEAEYLLNQGFTNITLLDIAPIVVEAVSQKLKSHIDSGNLTVICRDFFEHKGSYQLILEQTFFCAIPVGLRKQYASKMHELLSQNGILAGLLFNFPLTEQGPPFGGSKDEYLGYFDPLFTVLKLEECINSIKSREGRELFMLLQKK